MIFFYSLTFIKGVDHKKNENLINKRIILQPKVIKKLILQQTFLTHCFNVVKCKH